MGMAPTPTLSGLEGPAPTERGILYGLQRQAHVYAGTVPVGEIRNRRIKNRAARKARRLNRKGN